MLNKNKYRDFLLRKMEAKTPTIAMAGNVALTITPVDAQIEQNHSRRFFKKTLVLSSAICGALILVLATPFAVKAIQNANASSWIMSVGERDYMAARIYSQVVKNDESVPYVSKTNYNDYSDFSGCYKYTNLAVLDSYYVITSYESNLTPYFPEDFVGKNIDTIIALLRFDIISNTTQRPWNFKIPMIILNYNNDIHGFLSTSASNSDDIEDLSFYDSITFGSHLFLGDHEIIDDDGHDGIVGITIKGKPKENLTISAEYSMRVSSNDVPIPCSLDNDSYKPMGKEETIDLLDQTKEEKIDGSAVITAIDKTSWTLSVSSEALPTLQTIKFTQLKTDSATYEFDPDGILGVGDEIYFSYYERYQGYQPVNLSIYTITVKK